MYGNPDYQIILDGPRTFKNFLYDSYQDKSMIGQKKKRVLRFRTLLLSFQILF